MQEIETVGNVNCVDILLYCQAVGLIRMLLLRKKFNSGGVFS